MRIYADAAYKHPRAERAVKEIKLRMAILLHLKGSLHFGIFVWSYKGLFSLGKKLNAWKEHLLHIVTVINSHNKSQSFGTFAMILKHYFIKTAPPHFPAHPKLFQYKVSHQQCTIKKQV